MASTQPERETGQRVTLELSAPAIAELEWLRQVTSESKASLLRFALIALGLYVRAKLRGEEVRFVDPSNPEVQRVLEFPFHVHADNDAPKSSEPQPT